MAFNPFTSFRKYQKFWMATVLLLCMVTFVLCTGVGGDLSQRILDIFRPREGTPLAKVGGRSVYRKEFDNLKDQRNLVNAFMKQACEAALKNISLLMADQKIPQEQRKNLLPFWSKAKVDLEKRLGRTRYFGSGVKIEELLDFMVWQHEADRLGVTLVPDHVKEILLGTELMAKITKVNLDQMYGVIRDLKAVQRSPTEAMIVKGLSDEYRVRIAQTAMEYSDRENLVRRTDVKFQLESEPEVRALLSPAMLWDSFKENRSEFDVALVPILVDDFVKQVPAPTEAELKALFAAQANARFDPAAPMPGFEIPASTRVEVVVGDPASPNFKRWSKAAVIMEATPPVWIPSSPLTTLTRYAAGPLALRSQLEQQYAYLQVQAKKREQLERPSAVRNEYLGAAWNQPDVYGALAFKLASAYPEAAASWIAGYAQPSNFATAQLGFTAFGPVRHPKEMEAGLAAEVKERVPVYATVVLAGATTTGYQALGMLDALDKEKYFPLDVVKAQLTEFLEQKLAAKWMRINMIALRKHLELPENVGRKANFTRALTNDIQKMGLELRATKEFYNRFTIDKAPELQPLVKAFAHEYERFNTFEGRNLSPETALKEGDFFRLFFDGTEKFSVFGSTFNAKPWPPQFTPNKIALMGDPTFGQTDPNQKPQPIDWFGTDLPETRFLFWKIDDKPGKLPEAIDLVRDRVEKAWKFMKARETMALPKAKEIADRLQNSPTGFEPVLQLEALTAGRQRIDLKKLAPFYTDRRFELAGFPDQPGYRDYTLFPLPKGIFTYPRPDMAKEILSLHNLKKAIELHDARETNQAADADAVKLDEFNKALFEAGAKTGRMVQILTNKPRNAFYVACVTSSPGPSMNEFHSVLKYAFPAQAFRGGGDRYMDGFFDRAFKEAGNDYRQALMVQLRAQTNSEIQATTKERESFDSNEGV